MKIKISLILILIFSFSIIFRQSNAQVCLPLKGNLVWSQWQSYRIPMTSSYKYVLTSSPLYVTSSNVGVNTSPLAYKLQVNGSIAASSFCLGNSCRSYWTEGSITGSGSPGQVVFWTSSSSISGNDNLFWDSTTTRLGINTKNPSTTLHVNGDITAETFSGNINAGYVIPGIFGQDTGNGNYFFASKVAIGTTTIPTTISATTSLYVLNDYIRSDQGFCINKNNTTSCLDFAPINYWALTGTITSTTLYPTNTNWNISIGTTTNSNYKLQVNGAFNILNGGLVIDQTPQRGNWNSRVPLGNVITVVDRGTSTDQVGQHLSITIGSDGLPIISYFDSNYAFSPERGLKVLKCRTVDCSATNTNIITVVDSRDQSGYHTSITIGSDGLPIVAYYNGGNNTVSGLWFVKCNDLSCNSTNTNISTRVDSNDGAGFGASITIGTNGNPIIAYRNNSNDNLIFLKCNNIYCNSYSTITIDGSTDDNTSINLGTDGLPIIAYNTRLSGTKKLKVWKCYNQNCTSSSTTMVSDRSRWPSLTIGTDGLPIISFYTVQGNVGYLGVLKCSKFDCSDTTTNKITILTTSTPSSSDPSYNPSHSSITIGPDGLPIIAYRYVSSTNANFLNVLKCSKPDCSATTSNSIVTVDDIGPYGGTAGYNSKISLAIGSDGLPIIAYYDNKINSLKVLHCGNDRCLPYWQRR
jgi:hypothetical protein